MSRVLVIGGTGNIGRHLVMGSLNAGHPTTVLVRPATVSKHLHRIYHRHGLANRAAATRLLAGQPRLSDA
jgi:nucleoside-diphosphate-sugar epimerase